MFDRDAFERFADDLKVRLRSGEDLALTHLAAHCLFDEACRLRKDYGETVLEPGEVVAEYSTPCALSSALNHAYRVLTGREDKVAFCQYELGGAGFVNAIGIDVERLREILPDVESFEKYYDRDKGEMCYRISTRSRLTLETCTSARHVPEKDRKRIVIPAKGARFVGFGHFAWRGDGETKKTVLRPLDKAEWETKSIFY